MKLQADLDEWDICNPDHREDRLPQPYALVADILGETVLHQLGLAMFEIEQKKKDSNYEGSVKEYCSQNTIEIPNVACISSQVNQHNHLLAGDRKGCLFLLDLAKKVVFSKKELFPSRRVISISESLITDGDQTFTTTAVVLNSHPKVYVLRYRHGEQKLQLTQEVIVAPDASDPGKLPYACEWADYSRLLLVYTYDGSILMYRIPELTMDIEAINRTQTIPLEEEEFKKKLRYPLSYAQLQTQVALVSQPLLQVPFPRKKGNDESRGLVFREVELEDGQDCSASYDEPHQRPYLWVVSSRVELAKKKEFQRGRFVEVCQKIIYGWSNTRTFQVAQLFSPKVNHYPDYIYIQHALQRIPEVFAAEKRDYLAQPLQLRQPKTLRTIYDITATTLSQPDQLTFATGLANGTTSLWSTNALNVLLNLRKHRGAVTALAFFEAGWKLISGSSRGEVNIDNIPARRNEVSRTNIFESKADCPIASIRVTPLGVAFVLDRDSNLRAYDLWRNEKIARLQSCNSFAKMDNRGKRWLSCPTTSLYSNNDFTAVLSTNWPSYSPREIEDSAAKQEEVQKLVDNPWKCRGTNLHVVRNFEFLLSLFEGLETIYKKGYDRRKVENLFSNLEFAQLTDRGFDIPDFGISTFKKPNDKLNQSSKSHLSSKSRGRLVKDSMKESRQGNNSREGNNSRDGKNSREGKSSREGMKESSSSSMAKARLTNEVLHPEKFLLERRRVGESEVLSSERLKGKMLEGYKRQGALESTLQNSLSKGFL